MIMVDGLKVWTRRRPFQAGSCHLTTDGPLDELHAFAHDHGVPDAAFDVDHYDVPERMYDALVAGGALPVRATELIRRLIAGGVRVRAVERRS